jgi:hypothetical protein
MSTEPKEGAMFDRLSTQEFRDLEEAPLSSDPQAGTDDADADLRATVGDKIDEDTFEADLDEVVLEDEDDLASELSRPGYKVILESDIEQEDTHIHSPDMDAPNVPGEVDIEDLNEDDLGDALPPDARLDPLED